MRASPHPFLVTPTPATDVELDYRPFLILNIQKTMKTNSMPALFRRSFSALSLSVALLALAGAGCHKNDVAPPAAASGGVVVDLPKLQAAFRTGPQEARDITTSELPTDLRYMAYDKALAAMDKIAAVPNLTDAQKKVVSDVTDQIKQAAAAAAAPKPAQ